MGQRVENEVGAVVHDDVACHGCGYNLRGQGTAGACPECNAPVWISAAGESLRYAEPRWLARIIRGANIAMLGFVSVLLGPVIVFAVWGTGRAFEIGVVAVEIVAVGGMLWGLWQFSSPEPRGVETRLSARRWIRIGVITVPLTALIFVPLWATGPMPFLAAMLLVSPFGLVGVLAGDGYLRYVQQLARRLNRFLSVRLAAVCRVLLPALWTVGAVIELLESVAPNLQRFLVFVFPPLYLIVIFAINLPLWIFRPIRRALRESRRNWSLQSVRLPGDGLGR